MSKTAPEETYLEKMVEEEWEEQNRWKKNVTERKEK